MLSLTMLLFSAVNKVENIEKISALNEFTS